MNQILSLVLSSTGETLLMVLFSTVFSVLIGFPLGIILYITGPQGIIPKKILNQVLSRIIDVLRSFPFVILMIVLLLIQLYSLIY